jgi:hypothetical protein
MTQSTGLLDLSSQSDWTSPETYDPFTLNVTLRPWYWAKRQRLTTLRSVVRTVCNVRINHHDRGTQYMSATMNLNGRMVKEGFRG